MLDYNFEKPTRRQPMRRPAMLFPALIAGIFLLQAHALGAWEVVSAEDRTALELTIYGEDLAFVKDRRLLRLDGGTAEVMFKGVPGSIIPESARFFSLARDGSFRVLEQAFRYDPLTPGLLLDRYVGKKVTLYYRSPYTGFEESVEATLLSNPPEGGGPVYEIGGEITFGHEGRVILPSLPDDLFTEPTLLATVENAAAGPQEVEADYLARGMGWTADYAITGGEDYDTASLSCRVTVQNRSGADYHDASLRLVAGQVHRAGQKRRALAPAAAAATEGFAEEGLFEYHLYAMDRKVTIMDGEARQFSLLGASGVPVTKDYVFRGASYYYGSPSPPIAPEQRVAVFLELSNTREANLGLPLPRGTARVYMRDSTGGLQFVGEDSVDHTPVGGSIRVRAGEAFDVTARRRQTMWKSLGERAFETAFDVTVSNQRAEEVRVRVIEPLPGEWEVLDASRQYRKLDAHTVEFSVPVAAGGEAVLSYKVRVRY
jgi:hypothetical protein